MIKPIQRLVSMFRVADNNIREFTQDIIPVREIKNGIIETTDRRYVKILEVEPINFMLRSSEEQFNIRSGDCTVRVNSTMLVKQSIAVAQVVPQY